MADYSDPVADERKRKYREGRRQELTLKVNNLLFLSNPISADIFISAVHEVIKAEKDRIL